MTLAQDDVKLLSLARDLRRRKARERQSLFVAEGVRAVEELVRSGLEIRGILTAPQLADAPRGAQLMADASSAGIETVAVNDAEFRSAAETESPQGVLGIAAIPERSLERITPDDHFRLLVLDALQDPGNIGTILRTAAAFAVSATVALPGTVDLWNAKVVRASMGAHFRHPAFHVTPDHLFAFLDRHTVELWGADTGGLPLSGVEPPARLALAVGNEGGGLGDNVRARTSRTIGIEISSGVESLNVAVATGILLHGLRA